MYKRQFTWSRRLKAASGQGRGVIVALAAVPLLGTFAQAILGGVTGLNGINPISGSSHFLVSTIIIPRCVLPGGRSAGVGGRVFFTFGHADEGLSGGAGGAGAD